MIVAGLIVFLVLVMIMIWVLAELANQPDGLNPRSISMYTLVLLWPITITFCPVILLGWWLGGYFDQERQKDES